jgi:hypothetical protein
MNEDTEVTELLRYFMGRGRDPGADAYLDAKPSGTSCKISPKTIRYADLMGALSDIPFPSVKGKSESARCAA